jgi:protein-disulfide isomerase
MLKYICLCPLLWFAGVANNIAIAEQAWVADEIFLQMDEMRKEIRQLQDKVSDLEQQLVTRQPKLEPVPLVGTENMALGKPDAAIAVLEFSDYECPYCAKHYKAVLPKLRERYIDTGIVKYIMEDFPLEFHANAKKAALAARCAGGQGHYWAMHNALFDARGQITDGLALAVVKQQKMDGAVFKTCLENPKTLAAIAQDMALGSRLGVNGTPAFLVGIIKNQQLVNYKRLDGAQSFEAFASVIDSFKKAIDR